MEQAGALVFVEVRTKAEQGLRTPEESVTAAKRRRLLATAYSYLQSMSSTCRSASTWWPSRSTCAASWRRVTHLENVVTGEDAAE